MKTDDTRILIDCDEEDFLIRLNPVLTKENKWSGEINVGIVVADPKSRILDDEDYYYLMQFANLICASVPLMEEDVEFRMKIERFLEKEKKKDLPIKGKCDNVIQVNFKEDGSK